MPDTLTQELSGTGIEVRSIDHIPPTERHGKVRDQFTFWFAATMNVFNIFLGAIAVEITGNFFWAAASFALGTVLGLMLVGFHAMQGPRLGVPQMIQSRGQFGFYGAVVLFAASIALDFGYLAAQLVIQAESMHLLVTGLSLQVWIIIIAIPVAFLAIWGYDWVHRWQRWMTVILGITFIIFLIQALSYGGLPAETSGFHLTSFAVFMTPLSLAATNMLSWAPYVSDYSRYLPEDVSPSKTFWGVMLGNAIPTIFCGILGAYIASLLPEVAGEGIAGAVQQVCGSWALIVLAISLIGSDAINAYTGMLALASIGSCFRDVRDKISTRLVGTTAILITGVVVAFLGYDSFVAKVTEFLELLLFVFIPWSAINLTDYYLVKHGNYDTASFFTPKGIYGGWMWKGLIPYALAVAVQIPFITTELYTGPIAKSLNGVNISWIVGGLAAFVFYVIALRIAKRGPEESLDPPPPTLDEPAGAA